MLLISWARVYDYIYVCLRKHLVFYLRRVFSIGFFKSISQVDMSTLEKESFNKQDLLLFLKSLLYDNPLFWTPVSKTLFS